MLPDSPVGLPTSKHFPEVNQIHKIAKRIPSGSLTSDRCFDVMECFDKTIFEPTQFGDVNKLSNSKQFRLVIRCEKYIYTARYAAVVNITVSTGARFSQLCTV